MNIFKHTAISKLLKAVHRKEFSTSWKQLAKASNQGGLVISCFHKKFNFYENQQFGKLDDIPLGSKGWSHNKSRGDHFTIHADIENYDKPNINFQDININPKLINALNEQSILLATDFQSRAIPIIRSGKHTMLAAETGCGKTIAFLLPIIENLIGVKCEELNTPNALIIIPNRELAYQIGVIAKLLADVVDLNVKVITGGKTKRLMLNPEFSDVDILIATPGVVGKLSTVGIYKLNKVLYTVFDEADSLLDDSFIDRIESLTKRVSQSQFVFSSATLPKKFPTVFEPIVEKLFYVTSPRLHRPLLNTTQKFLRLSRSSRPAYLLEIAKSARDPMLIFSNKNSTCDWIAMFLRERGIKCANINGAMNYDIRIEQWRQFVSGEVNILSATDVGSRGLDTTQVRQVLNYDFPLYASDYIHRIGRVGRLGSPHDSKIINFISGLIEIKLVQQIERAVRTYTEIPNVDANIKSIIQKKILKSIRESG